MLASTSHQASAVARLAELSLPGRVHIGPTISEPVRRLPSGAPRIDAVLGGGVLRGRINEVVGPLSSGKTSFLFALLAATTRRGEAVACVDFSDALHPQSVAVAGADLQRLLWVRPRSATDGLRCVELLLQAGGFALVAFDLGELPRTLHSHAWPRLARAAEQSHTGLVIVAPRRVAGSFAALSLGMRARAPRWRHGLWSLFDGLDTSAVVARNKLGPPGQTVVIRVQDGSRAFPLLDSPSPGGRKERRGRAR